MAKIGQNNTNPDMAQTEELGKDLARQIEAKTDHAKVEYVAVVYRSGGELRTTELFSKGSYNSAPLSQAVAAAGGADNVLAVVHNHTKKNVEMQFDQSSALSHERLPSSRPHDPKNPADWDAAQNAFGSRSDVAYYLLDPEDKLRRYDYADREHWIKEIQPPPKIGPSHGSKTLHPAPEIDMQPSQAPVATTTVPAAAAAADPTTTPSAPPPATALTATATALTDPHAVHLQTQARGAVASMEAGLGVAWNDNSERVAACVGRLAYQQGFDGIVAVAPNRASAAHPAGDLVCVQGHSSSPDPYANRAIIATAEAIATPVEESLRRTQVLHNEAQTQTQTQTPAEPSQQPMLSR